ncbi:stage III sporulation protein AG [Diplocloster hominis]|uniref:stage III sporulation protein AG n=1 Tax=Diplocloster hominis TaxID=3079010 RepID=UPI0031BAD5E9
MKMGKLNIKNLKKDQLLIILLVGVLLVIIALPTDKKSKTQEEKEQPTAQQAGAVSPNSDETELEQKLKRALSQVEGVGKVDVMITLKSKGEKIVEKDQNTTGNVVTETDSEGGTRETKETNTQETTIYAQEGSGTQTPYVIKELGPEIEGVIIIAEGGGDARVVQNITDAVEALFHVEAHKIKVMKMK